MLNEVHPNLLMKLGTTTYLLGCMHASPSLIKMNTKVCSLIIFMGNLFLTS